MSNKNENLEKNKRFLNYIDGVLYFDKINLNELLKQVKTPAFIISQRVLLHQYTELLNAFSSTGAKSFNIAFSVKSNPSPEIAKTFVDKNTYFEVTSIGEIKHVLEQGCSPSQIIYTNIVKSEHALKYAIKIGVGLLAIDSWSDMKKIEKVSKAINKQATVLIRVNPVIKVENTVFACSSQTSKIGIVTPENIREKSTFKSVLLHSINSHWLNFQGIHVHLGSQIVDIKQYEVGMKRISNLIYQLLQEGFKINILDIGGGYPINYNGEPVPPIEEYAKIISKVFKNHLRSIQLIIESGRFLTAPAGLLALTVSVIKKEPTGLPIACVDGSFYNTIPDVIMADWSFPIRKIFNDEKAQMITYRIVGSSNDTLDYYKGGKNADGRVSLQKLEEGEYIAFLQSGAYSISFNSTYSMEERPLVYFNFNTSKK